MKTFLSGKKGQRMNTEKGKALLHCSGIRYLSGYGI
jgi:hypothetical protein